MNKTILALVLGAGGLVGGVARADHDNWNGYRPAYAPAYAPGYGFRSGARPDVSRFIRHIRTEVRTVVSDVRFDVEQGVVRPDIFPALTSGEREIDRDLRSAAQKGFFTPDDRMHLEQHVEELKCLRDRFRAQPDVQYQGEGDYND